MPKMRARAHYQQKGEILRGVPQGHIGRRGPEAGPQKLSDQQRGFSRTHEGGGVMPAWMLVAILLVWVFPLTVAVLYLILQVARLQLIAKAQAEQPEGAS
jgi:hypothetical protein